MPGIGHHAFVATVLKTRAEALSPRARALRVLHNWVGAGELACLGYVWACAITRRRDAWLRVAIGVLVGEGLVLLTLNSCPLGILQRQAGDDVPMFEVWVGPRLAPFAVPALTATTVAGMVLLLVRGPSRRGNAKEARAGVPNLAAPLIEMYMRRLEMASRSDGARRHLRQAHWEDDRPR